MRILLAVIDDLFSFAYNALFGVLVLTTKEVVRNNQLLLSGQATSQMQLPTLQGTYSRESEKEDQNSSLYVSFAQGGYYFVGIPNTLLYVEPVVAFDMVQKSLAYGELIQVLKLGGRWAQVRVGTMEGWIFRDALREQAKDVFPTFTEQIVYTADNEETKKLRMCIEDTFYANDALLPLTDAEYVTYKMMRKGKYISWEEDRPRIAGTWQKKLRGKIGIHIGIVPKTESVMEYVQEDQGHLCYVEAVFPDLSIKISSIGLFTEGLYQDMLMQRDEWKELRPVFIEVS